MKPNEAGRFYDAERTNVTLNHSDFCVKEDNDYMSEKNEITEYLLFKNWDDIIKSKTIVHEIKAINHIFEEVHLKFQNKIDSIEIFSLITDFYNIDYSSTFSKLLAKNRKILILDLERNSGNKIFVTKIDVDKSNDENEDIDADSFLFAVLDI